MYPSPHGSQASIIDYFTAHPAPVRSMALSVMLTWTPARPEIVRDANLVRLARDVCRYTESRR